MLRLLVSVSLFAVAVVYSSPVHGEEESTRASRVLESLYRPDGSVLVVAHRGDWRNAPENSIQAIENAVAMGVDIVEIDIRMTKDRRFVVMHDKTLDRTTTGTGKLAHHTLAEIKQLCLRNGYGVPTSHQVPTLEEAIAAADGQALLYLDKSEHMIAEVLSAVREANASDEVLFYGKHDAATLKEELGLRRTEIHYLPKLGEGTSNPRDYIDAHASSCPAFVTSFSTEDSHVLEHFEYLIAAKRRVWASPLWPEICAGRTDDLAVDEPDEAWGWLVERGATILCTDRPRELLTYLRKHGLHD